MVDVNNELVGIVGMRRVERKKEATEDGEGGKEAEDGDKSDGSMGVKREVRMKEGKRMEHLEDDKREKGSENGGRSLKERG